MFWTRSHTAKLKQKVVQAGATLEDTISETTQLVVAARDTSATDAAAHLTNLPKAVPLRSKKWEGRKLKIPINVDFVVPQYISDCLVQNRMLPTNAYLIALQQVATKDTRTYSHEEVAGNSNEAPEVNQIQPEAKAQPQEPQMGLDSTAQEAEQRLEKPAAAVPEHQQGAASATAAVTLQAPPAHQPASKPAEPETRADAGRLSIYPDINPQGRSFTGGGTGIPWGTGETYSWHLQTLFQIAHVANGVCC